MIFVFIRGHSRQIYAVSRTIINLEIRLCKGLTHAHCSILANACNMVALLFLFFTLVGSAFKLRVHNASREGTSGGLGVCVDL